MKKLFIILLFFISCLITSIENQYTKITNPIPEEENSAQENKIPSTLKNHLLRFAIIGAFLFKKNEIISNIKKHPYITITFAGLFIKYIIDSNKKYKAIKKDFDTLQMIQELYDLILYSIEINNIMMLISPPTRSFSSNEHFNQITEGLPYSFDELASITKQILIKWKLKIKHEYPNLYRMQKTTNRTTIYIGDVEDVVYYFYKNPLETYQSVCEKIAYKIKLIVQNILQLKIIDSL